MCTSAIADANSQAVDLAAFSTKAAIQDALALMEESYCIADELDGRSAKSIRKRLRVARRSLHRAWKHSQLASLANAGIQYASIAMADVGARAVHGGLRSLRAQVLWLDASAKGDRADTLSRYASSIPMTSTSLFGGRLSSAVAKVASNVRTYAAMADGFVQAGLQCPKPPCSSWKGKRRLSGSPLPF